MTQDRLANDQRTETMSDTTRLSWLEEMFEHCPHAIVRYNDDRDEEDEAGPVPLGWSIRVTGCVPLNVQADTFRGVIDAGIAESERQNRALAAGEDPEA